MLVWDHGSSVFWSLLCVVLSITTAYIVCWAIYSRFRIRPCAKTPRKSSWLPLIQSLCNMGCLKLFLLNLSHRYSSCFEELVSTDLITCPYLSLLPAFQLFLLSGAIFFWHLPSPSTFFSPVTLGFFFPTWRTWPATCATVKHSIMSPHSLTLQQRFLLTDSTLTTNRIEFFRFVTQNEIICSLMHPFLSDFYVRKLTLFCGTSI